MCRTRSVTVEPRARTYSVCRLTTSCIEAAGGSSNPHEDISKPGEHSSRFNRFLLIFIDKVSC